jgi:prepilin-type processing-associated H-X9-DG protein
MSFENFGPYVGEQSPGAVFLPSTNGSAFANPNPSPRRSVWHCPGYDRLPAIYGARTWFGGAYAYNYNGAIDPGYGLAYSGFGLAGNPVSDDTAWFFVPPIRDAQVLHPASMFAMTDSQLSRVYNDFQRTSKSPVVIMGYSRMILEQIPQHYLDFNGSIIGLADGGYYQRRHDTRFNSLFCDGHVETLKISGLFTLRSDDVLARWNNDGQPHRELIGGGLPPSGLSPW